MGRFSDLALEEVGSTISNAARQRLTCFVEEPGDLRGQRVTLFGRNPLRVAKITKLKATFTELDRALVFRIMVRLLS